MGPAIWLAMARDELRAAELLAEHHIAPLSCLHADQAVEKALRALQLHRGGSVGCSVFGVGSELPAPNTQHPTPNTEHRAGAQRRGLAAALASLSLHSAHRSPAGADAETELAREAVQVAHELIDRITERVYGA